MNRPEANPRRAKVTLNTKSSGEYLTTQNGRLSYNPYEEVGFEPEPFYRQNAGCECNDPLQDFECDNPLQDSMGE